MARKTVDWDEWYPVYLLGEPNEYTEAITFDVPDELVARYERVNAEFDAVQAELRKIRPRKVA